MASFTSRTSINAAASVHRIHNGHSDSRAQHVSESECQQNHIDLLDRLAGLHRFQERSLRSISRSLTILTQAVDHMAKEQEWWGARANKQAWDLEQELRQEVPSNMTIPWKEEAREKLRAQIQEVQAQTDIENQKINTLGNALTDLLVWYGEVLEKKDNEEPSPYTETRYTFVRLPSKIAADDGTAVTVNTDTNHDPDFQPHSNQTSSSLPATFSTACDEQFGAKTNNRPHLISGSKPSGPASRSPWCPTALNMAFVEYENRAGEYIKSEDDNKPAKRRREDDKHDGHDPATQYAPKRQKTNIKKNESRGERVIREASCCSGAARPSPLSRANDHGGGDNSAISIRSPSTEETILQQYQRKKKGVK